jgi:hypothetical protein
VSRPSAEVVSRRAPLGGFARRGWLLLVVVVVFLTFGVPRWLAGDVGETTSHGAADFTKLCREHGGTPARGAQPVCTVRYGGQVYRMDAITPAGFDADTARFQRQGCELAQQEQSGHGRGSFVYHPLTGVCEHRR